MKALIKNFGKKIIACPKCQGRLRIPIKSGKNLNIRCPRCSNHFDIRFSNPFKEFFTWYPERSFRSNLVSYNYRWKSLSMDGKLSIILAFVMLLIFFQFIFGIGKTKKEKIHFSDDIVRTI